MVADRIVRCIPLDQVDVNPQVRRNCDEAKIAELAASIRILRRNTRTAYAHTAGRSLGWCEDRGLALERIDSLIVAASVIRRLRRILLLEGQSG